MKKLTYLVNITVYFLPLLFFSCFDNSLEENIPVSSDSAEVTVTFPFFVPYAVIINSTADNWVDHSIWQTGTNSYKYTYRNFTGSQKVSIKYGVSGQPPEPFDLYPQWVNGPNGIECAEVKINGVMLDRAYSTDNGLGGTDITFKLNSDGTPSPGGTSISYNDNVPPEAAHQKRYVGNSLPPSGQQYLQAWVEAIHDYRYPSNVSTVEVRSIKLYSYLQGNSYPTLLQNYTYIPNTTFYDGGLFYRYPWFIRGQYDYHSPMSPYAVINSMGELSFHPSDLKLKVWHWWNEPRVLVPSNSYAFRVEVETRITGKVCVQAGLDFKSAAEPRGTECGAGDWFFESPYWQTVVFDSKN